MLETILLIFGAVQGFMIAVILFTQKHNRSANFYLGLFMVALASQLVMALSRSDTDKPAYLLGDVSFESFFLLGPLLYGYTRAIIQQRLLPSPRLTVHFLPFFLFLLLRALLYKTSFFSFLSVFLSVAVLPAIVFGALQLLSVLAYIYASFRVIHRYQLRIKTNYTNPEKISLKWWLWTLLPIQVLQVLLIIDTKQVLLHHQFLLHPLIIFGLITALSYWIAYKAYSQPNMFRSLLAEEATPVPFKKSETPASLKTDLSDEDSILLKRSLVSLMKEDKPYVDSQITVEALATKLGVTSKLLDEVIQRHFSKNFGDFINQYRLKYAKKLLADASKNHVPITNIGFNAGFNSLKNFQKAFEKDLRTSPSEFRESSQKDK